MLQKRCVVVFWEDDLGLSHNSHISFVFRGCTMLLWGYKGYVIISMLCSDWLIRILFHHHVVTERFTNKNEADCTWSYDFHKNSKWGRQAFCKNIHRDEHFRKHLEVELNISEAYAFEWKHGMHYQWQTLIALNTIRCRWVMIKRAHDSL